MTHKSGTPPRLGLIGAGAFGQLVAQTLRAHFDIVVHDPDPGICLPDGVRRGTLTQAARQPVVILAIPVQALADTLVTIAPMLRPGALLLDVASVKVLAADLMQRHIPEHVNLVATHPLFGPQSARAGLKGLKIVLCPLRGDQHRPMALFLRRHLGLQVMYASPESHDRDMAYVQGVTHLVAKVLDRMALSPTRMTTLSYDRLCEATSFVSDDPANVFQAIETANPFVAAMQDTFFAMVQEVRQDLDPP